MTTSYSPASDAQIAELRSHLPLTDPDRHSLDYDADAAFAALAAAHPEAVTPYAPVESWKPEVTL